MKSAQLFHQQFKMKLVVLVVLIGAVALKVEAGSIGVQSNDYEVPKVLRENMEQSFSCTMQMGQRARQVPQIQGIQILPEDNDALCEMWGCMWKKKGIIEESGDIHADALENYLVDLSSIFTTLSSDELKEAHELTNRCVKEESDRYCKKAIKIQNCINRYLMENSSLLRR